MSSSAQLAEKNQHHPDWRNLYNTVDVTVTTDDKACLSTFDIELAQGMDALYTAQTKK
jgi:4a-hydroxytetrahydrobiopterin dehydratase